MRNFRWVKIVKDVFLQERIGEGSADWWLMAWFEDAGLMGCSTCSDHQMVKVPGEFQHIPTTNLLLRCSLMPGTTSFKAFQEPSSPA